MYLYNCLHNISVMYMLPAINVINTIHTYNGEHFDVVGSFYNTVSTTLQHILLDIFTSSDIFKYFVDIGVLHMC